jgi:hypothetical protein
MDIPALLLQNWQNFMQIVGSVFEISGAYLMANHYLNAPKEQIPRLFISVLRWKDQGSDAEIERTVNRLRELSPERTIITIRGLAFISIGFFIQALSTIISMLLQVDFGGQN